MTDSEERALAWSELQSIVEAAKCELHRSEGSHIIVIDREFWKSGENGSDGATPFLKAFPDTENGYIAAKSAILRRFKHLNTAPIVCASCGQARSADQYDARFLGKPVKKYCLTCRGQTPESIEQRRQQFLAEQRARNAIDKARQAYQERFPEYHWHFSFDMSLEEMEAEAGRLEALPKQIEAWKAYCDSKGFDDRLVRRIINVHRALDATELTWKEVRASFLALDPPYLGKLERPATSISPKKRQELYEQQGGKCAYCAVELLPLNYRKLPQRMAYYRDVTEFYGVIPDDGMVMLDRDRIPQLEHRIPVSRGGTDDLENLCFACRTCNGVKGVRTVEEFNAMPDDAITKLRISPSIIMEGLLCEQRGYERFDDDDAKVAAKHVSRLP